MSENEIKPAAWRFKTFSPWHDDLFQWGYCDSVEAHGSATLDGYSPLYDQSAIDRLTAERDVAVADAERYRWLRGRTFSFSHDEESRGICASRWGEWPYDTDEGRAAVMDKAIDAAMTERQP